MLHGRLIRYLQSRMRWQKHNPANKCEHQIKLNPKSSETPWTQKLLILPLVSAACRRDATEDPASLWFFFCFVFFSSLPPTKSCMCTQLLPSSCKLLFSRVSGNSRQTLLSLQHCSCQSGPPPTHLLPACLPEGREPSVACCQDCRRSDGWMDRWMC